jgi:hypothetical protein
VYPETTLSAGNDVICRKRRYLPETTLSTRYHTSASGAVSSNINHLKKIEVSFLRGRILLDPEAAHKPHLFRYLIVVLHPQFRQTVYQKKFGLAVGGALVTACA